MISFYFIQIYGIYLPALLSAPKSPIHTQIGLLVQVKTSSDNFQFPISGQYSCIRAIPLFYEEEIAGIHESREPFWQADPFPLNQAPFQGCPGDA